MATLPKSTQSEGCNDSYRYPSRLENLDWSDRQKKNNYIIPLGVCTHAAVGAFAQSLVLRRILLSGKKYFNFIISSRLKFLSIGMLFLYAAINAFVKLSPFWLNKKAMEKPFYIYENKTSDDAVIYFTPTSDYNGAFASAYDSYNFMRLRDKYSIIRVPVKHTQDIIEVLENFKLLIIGGHGTSSSIKLSNNFWITKDDSMNELCKAIVDVCDKDTTIVLRACSTGKGRDSIASRFAEGIKPRTVIAPIDKVNISSINTDKNGKIKGISMYDSIVNDNIYSLLMNLLIPNPLKQSSFESPWELLDCDPHERLDREFIFSSGVPST